MQLKKHILPLLLALALILTAAGCGAKTPEPEPAPAETPAAAEDHSIVYEATGVHADEVVATLGDVEATAEMLTYEIGYVCSYINYALQSYGMGELDIAGTLPSGESAAEYVREEALELLTQQLVLEQLAAENGITLSAEDEAEIDAERDADIAEVGEETYLARLRSMGLSPEGYDRVVRRAGYLYQALSDSVADPNSPLYVSGDKFAALADSEGYITADHILLMTIDSDTREPLDDETVSLRRALAEDLLERLRGSTDPVALFGELADTYSEDPGRQTNPAGYTFKKGTMVDSFDAAARALKENSISDIVESEYGFHIILRRPLDIVAATDAVRETYFDDLFLERADEAKLTLTPVMDRIDLVAVYQALSAAQEEVFGG